MGSNNVKVFVSDDCSECHEVIGHLNSWNVTYELENITQSKEALREMQQMRIYSAPLVLINGNKIHGIKPDAMKQELGIINRHVSARRKGKCSLSSGKNHRTLLQ